MSERIISFYTIINRITKTFLENKFRIGVFFFVRKYE